MSYWYEVFDNEQVQLLTRKQAGRLTIVAALAVGATLGLIAVGNATAVPMEAIILLIIGGWMLVTWGILQRLRSLRRVVWCVKISDRYVVGYDYTRKKTAIDWTKVERLEVTPKGLVVVGPDGYMLEVPHLFPDFAELSHRIAYYAEFYGLPIFINGQPWQELDVYNLYPFLEDDASPDPPGPATR